MPTYSKRIARILAHNLKFERLERQWVQEEVAKRAKLSLRQYQKLELGQTNPTMETLCNLAQAFGITVDHWMRLRRIRTLHSADHYLELFRNVFQKAGVAAGVRTLQGIALWGDPATRSLPLPSTGAKQVDLFKVLHGPAAQILRSQLVCEQKGHATTYTNFFVDPKTGDTVFMRYYPVLIFPEYGNEAYFAVLYITPPERDSQLEYFKFCDLLLSID